MEEEGKKGSEEGKIAPLCLHKLISPTHPPTHLSQRHRYSHARPDCERRRGGEAGQLA